MTSVYPADNNQQQHKKEVMTRLEQAREHLAYFARMLTAEGISVGMREEVDLTIAYVGLPDRTFLRRVADAQTKVIEQYGEPTFEILVYYPEDLRRKSIKQLIAKTITI